MKKGLNTKRIVASLCFTGVLTVTGVFLPKTCWSQSSSASATPAGTSLGRPSTIAIQQNSLALQQAALQRKINDAQRCIDNASKLITLRDPEGNINRVPQIDSIECSRKLQQYLRQSASLQRKYDALAKDAEADALYAEREARNAARAQRVAPLRSR